MTTTLVSFDDTINNNHRTFNLYFDYFYFKDVLAYEA